MTIDVFANLFLSNGDNPTVSAMVQTDDGEIKFSPVSVKFSLKMEIINGLIIVHFTPVSDEHNFWDSWDNIFELAKIIIDPIILTRALHLGQGLLYTITLGRAEDGSTFKPNPDTASEPNFDLTTSQQADPIVRLLVNNFRFKFAVRDFNMGLLDRKDCALYFYREIETLARIIGGENKEGQAEWDKFFDKIVASEDEKGQLKNKDKDSTIRYSADKLRHGKAPGQRHPQEWEDMKKTAKSILVKSAKYLIDNP
jgi:hypothetical protein